MADVPVWFRWLGLGYFVVSLVANCISTWKFARILHHVYVKSGEGVVVFFSCLLANYWVTALTMLPYDVYLPATWSPADNSTRSGLTLFWISVPPHSFLSVIPVSVFFLTLDRTLTISYVGRYDALWKRRLVLLYIVVAIFFYVFNFLVFCRALPVPQQTSCYTHGCITSSDLKFYLYWRCGCALINFINGLVFFRLLWKHQSGNKSQTNNRSAANRANNIAAGLAVAIEFFLILLPHLNLVIWRFTTTNVSLTWGAYSSVFGAIETLISAVVYSQVLRKARDDKSRTGKAGPTTAVTAVTRHNNRILPAVGNPG